MSFQAAPLRHAIEITPGGLPILDLLLAKWRPAVDQQAWEALMALDSAAVDILQELDSQQDDIRNPSAYVQRAVSNVKAQVDAVNQRALATSTASQGAFADATAAAATAAAMQFQTLNSLLQPVVPLVQPVQYMAAPGVMLDEKAMLALQTATPEVVTQVLAELQSKGAEVRNPSAYVQRALANARNKVGLAGQAAGQGGDVTTRLDEDAKRALQELNAEASQRILQQLIDAGDKVNNPSAYVMKAVRNAQQEGGVAGEPRPAGSLSLDTIHTGAISETELEEERAQEMRAFASALDEKAMSALRELPAGSALHILRNLRRQASQVTNASAWVCKAVGNMKRPPTTALPTAVPESTPQLELGLPSWALIGPSMTFRLGVIADIQRAGRSSGNGYADCEDGSDFSGTERRYFRNALKVARRAVEQWNAPRLLVAQLGDIIDGCNAGRGQSETALKAVLDVLAGSKAPRFDLIGNHELYNLRRESLEKSGLRLGPGGALEWKASKLDAGQSYYTASELRWTCYAHLGDFWEGIFLDPYELAPVLIGLPEDSPKFLEAKKRMQRHNPQVLSGAKDWFSGLPVEKHRYVPYNGGSDFLANAGESGISQEQLSFLDSAEGRKVLIFLHVPLFEPATKAKTVVWNAEEVLQVLHAKKDTVVAVFAGHDHDGGYAVDDAGLHHITMNSPLTAVSENCCGVLTCHEGWAHFKAYGRACAPHSEVGEIAWWPPAMRCFNLLAFQCLVAVSMWLWVKTNHQGTAGFSLWFHLPGVHFGVTLFLTHSNVTTQS
ncbi:unnamed protein product [Effrenium voratum]|nr:unnamed protein product [Effrenium voratum]